MEIARALILAGRDCDDRPWPTHPIGPKHLFPVANRPILSHNLEGLRDAGVLEATILAAPEAIEPIRDVVGDGREWRVHVRYSEWDHTGGVRAALAAERDFVGDEPVLVQQGDALLRERIRPHISTFTQEELDTLALRLAPSATTSPQLPMPGYLLSSRGVSILLDGDAGACPVAGVRARGGRVREQHVDGCLPCHGDEMGLLDSNRRMLEGLASAPEPRDLDGSTVQGAVSIHPTAEIRRSLLRGPLVIGPHARIVDAYIGPYTSIGAGVVMEGAEIEHSIVLDDAELRFVGTRLESSVIGRGARVVRAFRLPGTMRMAVGAGAEIVLA
jgi:glucose-1-phosphate thymidylyltransferase